MTGANGRRATGCPSGAPRMAVGTTMTTEPAYLTGEPVREGDLVRIGPWEGTVEEIVVEDCPYWEEYWRDATGEGVMLVGPEFGRLFNRFHDEELIFVGRKQA